MNIEMNRQSVCIGDDMEDHTISLSLENNATYENLFELLKSKKYFPNVSGNNVVWVLTAKKYECIFSYFTLQDKFSPGLSEKNLSVICSDNGSCKFLLKYYASPQRWKEEIYRIYNGDEYALWRDGWTDEIKYCDYLSGIGE